MGRPLKKAFFGDPANPGSQLFVTEAWIPGAAAAAAPNTVWIKKQVSKHRFLVSDGTVEGTVYLQAGPVTAEGQARIVVTPFGGAAEHAAQINNRTVKTFEGNVYSWDKEVPASVAGQADLFLA